MPERVLLTAVSGIKRVDPNAVIRVIAPVDGPLLSALAAIGAEVEIVPMPKAADSIGRIASFAQQADGGAA